ncbi:hypothetical protein E2986_07847 [Frieseomelitta varia]|uniref:Uncharacterized protein n=1 Tax=Frieseomelitta varia TaxID=561572 RepID=A0A833W5Z3_9HYME|nr:uncharacterized protein LOC122535974 [Frieseomelitta varia]KAF3421993.1 hypothetical protein E2986_07847 [Frieseomelitta varia]
MNDMNTDVHQDNVPRLEKLAKPRKKTDKTNNYNAFNVKRGALSYQITDSLNRLAQPRRKPATNVSNISNFSTRNSPTSTVKQGHHKLINSSEQSKDAQESKKKKFLLDTYARITAARNKGCSRRLHELAKPKSRVIRTEPFDDFENYFQTMKKYNAKAPHQKRK